jgi:hypothetical protein
MPLSDPKKWIHDNLTDAAIADAIAKPIAGGPHAEANAVWQQLLRDELAWRQETGMHYTLEQRKQDLLDFYKEVIAAHHEKREVVQQAPWHERVKSVKS